MLKYASRPSEDVKFRENFISDDYFEDNGGDKSSATIVIDDGFTTPGSPFYLTYGNDERTQLGAGDWTISLEFSLPTIEQTYLISKNEDTNNRYYVRVNADGSIFVYMKEDGDIVFSVTTDVCITEANKLYKVQIVCDKSDTAYVYCDGAVITGSVAAFLTNNLDNDGDFEVGRWVAAYGTFTIKYCDIYHVAKSQAECIDINEKDTFTSVNPSAVIDLPMRTTFNDGSNIVTENIVGTNPIQGDGSTAGLMPTLISPHGTTWDGTQYMTITDDAELRTANVTVFALIKPTDDTSGRQAIVSSGNAKVYATNNFTFECLDGTGLRVFGRADNISIANVLNLNQFNTVAFTCDGTTTKLYVNGIEVISKAMVVGDDDTTGTYVGCANIDTLTYFFIGDMIVVKQFNGALTPTQIREEHNKAFANLNV